MTEPTQPATPAPASINPKKGRGLIIWGVVLFALSILIGVGGIVGGVVFAKSGIEKVNDFVRIEAPGEKTLVLDEGKLQIWVEADSLEKRMNPDLYIQIIDPISGDNVQITKPNATETYTLNGKYGRLIGTADIPGTREFTVLTEGDGESRAALGNLNLATSVFGTLGWIFGGIGLGSVLGLLGIVLFIVGLVQRSKAKKALAAQ